MRIETRALKHDGPVFLTRGLDGSVLCIAWRDNLRIMDVITVEPFELTHSQSFKEAPRNSFDIATAGHRRIKAPGRKTNISLTIHSIGKWPGDCLTLIDLGEKAGGHELHEVSVNGKYMITDKRLGNG